MRDTAITSLSARYPDFNKDAVIQAAARLEESPPGDEMRSFLELVYLAEKGRMSPAKMEEAITKNITHKQSLKAPVTSSGNVPGPKAGNFKNINEAYAEARKAYT